jgi:predicted dehydrogenase
MFRVGIVGCGVMGGVHAQSWARTPATVSGVYAIDTDQADALAQLHNVTAHASLDALIATVDVVDVCTPTDTHHDIVLRAAAAGKHVVCEKPLALTLEQGRAMLAACERAGVMLLVGHVVRFFPEYALAKSVVDEGKIGDVGVIRLKRSGFQPRRPNNWFLDYARSGGLLLDLMIHDFDYARWVGGDVVSVFAKTVRSQDPGAKGDYGQAILRHESGAISHVEGAWAYPPPMFQTALEIAGDGGLIEHPAASSIPIEVYLNTADNADLPDIAIPTSPLLDNPYVVEIAHFYDVLTGEDAPRITAADALAALQIGLAAIESAQANRAVTLEKL